MRNLFGAARPPAAEQAEILPRGLHFSIFGVEAAPGAEAAVASRLGPRRYVSFQSRGPMGSPRPVVTIYGRCPAKLAAVCRYRPPRALPDGSVSLKRSDPRYGRGLLPRGRSGTLLLTGRRGAAIHRADRNPGPAARRMGARPGSRLLGHRPDTAIVGFRPVLLLLGGGHPLGVPLPPPRAHRYVFRAPPVNWHRLLPANKVRIMRTYLPGSRATDGRKYIPYRARGRFSISPHPSGELGYSARRRNVFCRCAALYPETSGATPAPRRASPTRFQNLHHAVCAIAELFEAARRDPPSYPPI